jgi:formylglycine-generating enzyme required for sulfatase activity
VTGVAPTRRERSLTGRDVAVDQLSYAQALAFCEAMSRAEGIEVGLPTEAQWEYACRAGTITRFWSGNDDADLAKVGWYRDNSGESPQPVGLKPANPWGFYDMHGNVCECCRDVLPPYRLIEERDPIGPISTTEGIEELARGSPWISSSMGPLRSKTEWINGIMRGGAWMFPASACRSASRLMSDDMFGGAGLRIAVTVPRRV